MQISRKVEFTIFNPENSAANYIVLDRSTHDLLAFMQDLLAEYPNGIEDATIEYHDPVMYEHNKIKYIAFVYILKIEVTTDES